MPKVSFVGRFAKNYEGAKILANLQANTFHECWEKTQDTFITHSTVSIVIISIFVSFPFANKFHGLMLWAQMDVCIYSGLHYLRGNLNLGNLLILLIACK